MPYPRSSLPALIAQAQQDIIPVAGQALLPESVLGDLAVAYSGLIYEMGSYLDWIALQITPATATDAQLETWGALRGVNRKPASSATGTVTVTGTTGAVVPAGTTLFRSDLTAYTSTAEFVIGSTETCPVTAAVPGAAANAAAGLTLTISTSIAGVQSGAVASVLVGGADQETDDALRARILAAYASTPSGGTLADYVSWVEAVPGVASAWCNPDGAGRGSVVIYPYMTGYGLPNGTNGVATSETRYGGAHATGDQLTVANALYPLQPVTALVYVAAPVAQAIPFSIQGLTPNTTAVQAGIATALSDLFVRQGTPLGGTIALSDVNAAMEAVSGLVSYSLLSPSQAITTGIGSLPVVGAVTYT